MDLKVATVIVCLCALAISPTEAGIPKCCVRTTTCSIARRFLMKVERSYVQLSSGACDISALILYVKGRDKPICAPLKMKAILEIVHRRMKQNKMKAAF
ncbi:putative C-C motif chemokine 28 [Scophthalmus maximus]|uniref:Putative C-C motif chemokine 28 n=1 Tax=Scophthalmus maximus TaxID=52904 RepID=A0A2U9BSX3_SCOMX|nr:C-C motif chemokine 27b [Scophthalmus maximus]AWP07327.1 putative C-C motif chemokine 28 [Scophthalmus maximus]